ncbi:hypothetical protein GF359_03885 [candidate division WOR-3 bacterium]|uniref:Uncharacterized protein n=1 Tax=candidate division WOR-3 bacterium TaxID=2052148 RepID=A0A9D5K8L7_UNCW3|nr:hypothetical protein [candidate division WOR-3 bacterium]MBD3364337.1 hypothetical protein [candidate division WOR-3 bacterium]
MSAVMILVFLAGVVFSFAAIRFVTAVRKLAAGGHDTRSRNAGTNQDKPPLVFWTVASPILAAAFAALVILIL